MPDDLPASWLERNSLGQDWFGKCHGYFCFFLTITSSITVRRSVTFGSAGNFASSTFSSRCTICCVTSVLTALFTYPTCLPSQPRKPVPFFFWAITSPTLQQGP